MQRPELLAPAGSKEALIAAIDKGADAVYFGGTVFSARQYAGNFTHEELEWAIDYSHIRGVKSYVTVNTLIKDTELEDAMDYLQFLCSCGTDAVIVQDMGILRTLREELPELPVHASTQMTIHNVEGVKFLKDMDVKRVVLAREMSLDEIKRIKSETRIEIETFIHGALCFSYSGQCLLSSMIGGRSGNRGYCAQPCRRKYRVNDLEGYLLSPRDLNMSEHIGSLIDAGIDSLKIEGRMKRPEYVAGVVGVYRNLVDRYIDSPTNFKVTADEKHTLLQLFNREFTTGYFFGSPGAKLMSRKYPHNIGTRLGKVIDYEPQRKLAEINLMAPLRAGDGIGIGARETGIIVRDLYIGAKAVSEADKGSTVTIPMEYEVKKGDAVFKTFDSRLMASLEVKNTRKIPIKMSIKARIGEPVELFINDSDNEVTVRGEMVGMAEKKPISKRSIAEQLKKLGTTNFEAQIINFEMDDDIFIPVSQLNSIRREGISQLGKLRAQKWKRHCAKPDIVINKRTVEPGTYLSVNTGSIECLEAAVDDGADVVYIGGEGFCEHKLERDELLHAIEYGRKKGAKVLVSTPRIVKEIEDLKLDMAPDGFLISNLGVLYHLCKHDMNKPIVIDYPFNIFNRLTMDFLLNSVFECQRVTLSPELTLKEIKNLTPFGPTECIVHGYFPLMVSEHDLIGGLSRGRDRDVMLKDEKGFNFPIKTDINDRTYVMNSRELCMLPHVPDIIKAGVNCLRIEARAYDRDKTGKITKAYRKAIDNSITEKAVGEQFRGKYTTGHYFRGVL